LKAQIVLTGLLSLIVAPLILLGLLIVFELATMPNPAIDPEGLAYVIFFGLWSLPGTALGLLLAAYMQRRIGSISTRVVGAFAAVASAIAASCGVFALTWTLFGPTVSFDTRMLLFPASVGALATAIFLWIVHIRPARLVVSHG
jgi:hypothetical protein